MKVILLTRNKKEMEPAENHQHKKDRSDHHGSDDRDVLEGAVVRISLHFCNFINYIHIFHNLAKYRVFGVEEVVVDEVDEELAASGVGASVCHGNCTPVISVVFCKLILDGIAGSATARTGGISPLQHETINNAVEDHAIIVAFFYERFEIACGYWHGWIESNGDVTHVSLEPYQFLFLRCCCHGNGPGRRTGGCLGRRLGATCSYQEGCNEETHQEY